MKTIGTIAALAILALLTLDYVHVRRENSDLQREIRQEKDLARTQTRVLGRYENVLDSCRETLDERVRISQEMALARAEAVDRFNKQRLNRVAWNRN
jgi:hypothetical protein